MSDRQPDEPAPAPAPAAAPVPAAAPASASATAGRPVVRRLLIVGAMVLAALGAIAIRVVVEGRAAVDAGDRAAAAGHPIDAIDLYETGARWYLPLAPHVDDAYARLRKLAASDNPGVALAAWRAIRSSARATRSLWTPHADDLAAADAAIAHLSARDPTSGQLAATTPATATTTTTTPPTTATGSATTGSATAATSTAAGSATTAAGSATTAAGSASTTGSATAATPTTAGSATTASAAATDEDLVAAREAWHRERLAGDVRPALGIAALAGLGIVLWLVGAAVLATRGLDRAGAWVRRPALMAGASIVVGLALWFVGLYNA